MSRMKEMKVSETGKNCELVADKATNKALHRIYLKFCLLKWFPFGNDAIDSVLLFYFRLSIEKKRNRAINKYEKGAKRTSNAALLYK